MKKTLKIMLLLLLIFGLTTSAFAEIQIKTHDNTTMLLSSTYANIDEHNKIAPYKNPEDSLKDLDTYSQNPMNYIRITLQKIFIKEDDTLETTYMLSYLILKPPNHDFIAPSKQPIKLTYQTKKNKNKTTIINQLTAHETAEYLTFTGHIVDKNTIEKIRQAQKITLELKSTKNKTLKLTLPGEKLAEWQHIIDTDLETIFPKDFATEKNHKIK